MGVLKFANNAKSTLAAPILAAAVNCSVQSSDASKFPALSAGDWFMAALKDASNNIEIVKVTARASGVLTIVRGQEGTTPRDFSAGAVVDMRLTAGTLAEIQNLSGIPSVATAKINLGVDRVDNTNDAEKPVSSATATALGALSAALVAMINALSTTVDGLAAVVNGGWRTGDLKIAYTDDGQPGWLLVDGRTIGSATSGATSRAHADTQALFLKAYAKYPNTICPIQDNTGAASSRTTAAADFAANKRLPLVDARGEFLRFLDLSRGVDVGRGLGSPQGDLVKSHDHAAEAVAGGSHDHGISTRDDADSPSGGFVGNNNGTNGGGRTLKTDAGGEHSHAVVVAANNGGGPENRPRNIAFPLFIKL